MKALPMDRRANLAPKGEAAALMRSFGNLIIMVELLIAAAEPGAYLCKGFPPMAWTSQTPTVAGIYWHFDRAELAICEIIVGEDGSDPLALLTGDDHLYEAAELTGLWCGPINPPGPPPKEAT
jgi:hypothetical protein